MIAHAIFNKTPLPPNRLSQLPLGAVQPQGWLKDQLDRQADQLQMHLSQRFPGLNGDSCWLGGPLQDGASAAQALSALTVIAYVTGRETLIQASERFVHQVIERQRPSGDFGPEDMTDWWPKMLMLRVMREHFMATGNKASLKLMDRFFLYQLEQLHEHPLTGDACSRASENMLAALWLYNITGQKHLLRLCQLLSAQSLDWTDEMHIFPHIRDTSKQRPWQELQQGLAREGDLNGANQKVNGREFYLTRGLDLALGLKAPGVTNLFKSGFKEVSALSVGWPKYLRQHGVALGMFTSDHHLAGSDPSRGVALDAVAEAIQSIRVLLGTGDELAQGLGDMLERLALNAPIAGWDSQCGLTPELLQTNQLSTQAGDHAFYNAKQSALCFEQRVLGLADPALCTYTGALWYATSDEGLAAIGYAPCTVRYQAGGTRVRVRVEGDYPFSGQVKVHVETKSPAEFPIYLRIPGWAGTVNLHLPDGELMQMQGGETACVRRQWLGEGVITLDLRMEPQLTRWAHQSAAVEMGPMTMALDLDEDSVWHWALMEGAPMKAVPAEKAVSLAPKAAEKMPHVLVKAQCVPQWEADGPDCARPPINPAGEGAAQVLALKPFCATTRRIAQFPLIKE